MIKLYKSVGKMERTFAAHAFSCMCASGCSEWCAKPHGNSASAHAINRGTDV